MTTAKFEDNFWGDGNHGFEVLLHNFKSQTTTSKELAEYIKERALVEDGYVKSLSKLHKTVVAVPEVHFGSFIPMWKLVKDTSEQLSSIHAKFFKMLSELSREITEYNIAQKEKQKTVMRGEIENANDSLTAFNTLDAQVQRTRKQYQQGAEHLAKAREKLNKAMADPAIHAKNKQHLESKVKQAQTWMETMKTDHQTAVRRQCEQLMEFQGKMKEACGKFESLEEEHLAQMSTFMLKLARSQNSTLVNIEQHYAAFNSHLDDLSVEKLLLEFVQAKGTGTEKPAPYKFRAIDVDVPPISLSTSSEDVRSSSPVPTLAPGPKNTSRGEKSIRNRFKKKKQKTVANGPIEEHQQPENAPEVDEEGYSIRPADAASISQFPDQPSASKSNSDSDSDFDDDEPESRIKTIKIKDTAGHPQATVDDIKASVMSLRLGATSPGIRKATSTHSLNAIPTPPANRKDSSTSGNNQTADDSKSVSSLLDLDDIIIGPPAPSAAGGLPPPLMPSLFNIDPMATLTPLSLQPSSSSSILTPTPAATTTTAPPTSSSSSNSLLLDPGMGTGNSPGPRPIPRPRNSSIKANSQEQKDPFSAFEEAKDQPTELPAASAGGIIPPLPNKKRKSTGVVPSTSSQSITSTTSATGGVTKSSSGYSIVSITSEKSFDSVMTPFETNFTGSSSLSTSNSVPSQDDTHLSTKSAQQQAEGDGAVTSRSAGSSPKMSSKFPKDGGASASSKSDQSDAGFKGILPPPQAAPRRGSGSSRRRSANPPLGTSGSSGGDLLLNQTSSPLATARVASSRSTSTSPVSFSGSSTNKTGQTGPSTNGVTSTSSTASSSQKTTAVAAIPIAVAVQETCNAIFKGNDMSKCVIKVAGEVMISFPASYVSQLASHDALAFKVANVDDVERLLHNQHLLKKEGDGYSYKFDMSALVTHLKQMKEKQNSPYCNVQILKYEVKANNGGQLPLKLVSFWKCEPSMTNFRLDYVYQPSNLKQLKKPAMTNMSVVVPVSGGVRKSLSKPEGSWVAEQNRMMWKLGDLQPTEEGRGTLHAKFDVTSGPTVPAPAVVQFLCDGATMSGLTFDLTSDAYRVSLTKNKCLSGKYIAEIVHHY